MRDIAKPMGQLELFYESLFDSGEWVNVRGFGDGRGSSKCIQLEHERSIGPLYEEADRVVSMGLNAGFGVAARKGDNGGGANNLLHTRAIWVDIDDPEIEFDDGEELIFGLCTSNGYPIPSWILWTGGGVHLYWLLEEAFDLSTPEAQSEFKGRLKGLAIKLGGDMQCCEPARIMRMPDTQNMKRKYDDCERPVAVLEAFDKYGVPEAAHCYDIGQFPKGGGKFREGERNNGIFTTGLALRDSGAAIEEATTQLVRLNLRECDPPMSDEEVQQIAYSVYSRAPRETQGEADDNLPPPVEREIARSFLDDEGDNYKYEQGGGWLVWNGKHWDLDGNHQTVAAMGRWLTRLRERAGGGSPLERMATRLLTFRGLSGLVAVASTLEGSWVSAEGFDSDHHAINFNNCTVRVGKDGTVQQSEHDRADYMTNVIPTNYNTEATCPRFLKFLNEIFAGEEDTIGYLQKRLGVALLGAIGDSKALIMYGDGANGKSVIASVLQNVLGTYCFPVPSSTLTGGSGEGDTKIASLQGKRVGLVHEFGSAAQLNDERFKMLTGGEALVSARHLYQKHFQFRPVTSFIILSNYLPAVKDSSHGLWRRMALIYFPVVIPEHEQDPALGDKIKEEESEGIAYWLTQGAAKYFSEGATEPKVVLEAMEDYRSAEDIIGAFVEDTYEPCPENRISLSDSYRALNRWLKDQGHNQWQVPSKVNFGRLVHGRIVKSESGGKTRVEKRKVGGKVVFVGIGVKQGEFKTPWELSLE